jgi:pimeloyl-ACP methyl ester carboxylesterase
MLPFHGSALTSCLPAAVACLPKFKVHHPPDGDAIRPRLTRRELLGVATLGSGIAFSATTATSASATSTASTSIDIAPTLPLETDQRGVERLALKPEGWNTWRWRGKHNVNWLSAGDSGPIVLLVHGFGASVYHWRYVVPKLSQHCRVYAIDCLGFGWSEKAIVDYNGYGVWTEQIADFVQEVIHNGNGSQQQSDKVVLVGNSLGGYNSLATAAAHLDLVRGVVLLNAAGRFDDATTSKQPAAPAADAAAAAANASPLRRIATVASDAVKRLSISVAFLYAKQPARVRQVLQQVYISPANIDDALVDSILIPAQDPKASEVFYRVITAQGTPVNVLLEKMQSVNMPLFLLWGSRDPWCVPARADQIQKAYPLADRVNIESGHCPHDDTPELVVGELLRWVQGLPA